MPSVVTMSVGAAAAATLLVESGIWRRGTVWGDAFTGARRRDDVIEPWQTPLARVAVADVSGSIQVAAPAPILRRHSPNRGLTDIAAGFEGISDEAELRTRFLALVADLRSRGGSVGDVAAAQRDVQSALVRVRAHRAVRALHHPPSAAQSPPEAGALPPRAVTRPASRADMPQPTRRPRRRALRQPDLVEEPSHPTDGRAAPPTTRPPPAPQGTSDESRQPAPDHIVRPSSGGRGRLAAKDGETRPLQISPTAPHTEARPESDRRERAARPSASETTVAPAAAARQQRTRRMQALPPTPVAPGQPGAAAEKHHETHLSEDAAAAAEYAASRVFAFLPEAASVSR
jgi:hypothetical protein